MSDGTKRRPGRPPREKGARTSPTLVFRPSPDTRKLIEEAAAESGQSLSAEIDRRLRQSFWDRDRYRAERERVFGGQHNFALAFLIARVATGVEHERGSSWRDDPLAWREVATAIVAMLQLMRGLRDALGELPLGADARPNPNWGAISTAHDPEGKEPARDPRWLHVLRLVEIMLSSVIPMHWPLVDTIKKAHDDFRDDIMPDADALRRLYAETGTSAEASSIERGQS